MNIEKSKQIAPQVVLAQHGNRSAYKSLYLAYYKNIFFICKLMSGDMIAAMNLTEQIFKKMFESVSKLSDHMAFEQWFYSIAINICKPVAANVDNTTANIGKDMAESVAEIRTSVIDGDKFGFERSIMALLEKLVVSLPYDFKSVFLYKYFVSLSDEKIALLEKKEESEIAEDIEAVGMFVARIGKKLCEEGVDISPFARDWENTLMYLAAHVFIPDSVHGKISEFVGVDVNPFATEY